MSYTRPFLKWAGGKFRLITPLQHFMPQSSVYIEPFVGAGAIFLNLPQTECHINDINPDLISLYKILKKEGAEFIRYAARWFVPKYNQPLAYYELRQLFNQRRLGRKRAALFLYLNRHGYNGLCRYNQKGGFNVPFGAYKKPYFPSTELHRFYERLQSTTLTQGHYQRVMKKAPPGSLIYCDPPYWPLTHSAHFTQYSQGGFSLEDQKKLAQLASDTASRGVHVIISNHDLPATRALYTSAVLHSLPVIRTISCQKRQPVMELFAYYAAQ